MTIGKTDPGSPKMYQPNPRRGTATRIKAIAIRVRLLIVPGWASDWLCRDA